MTFYTLHIIIVANEQGEINIFFKKLLVFVSPVFVCLLFLIFTVLVSGYEEVG
jgi:hypothetical protein